eukprot:2075323-Pyramimonas_sp.AAC.1
MSFEERLAAISLEIGARRRGVVAFAETRRKEEREQFTTEGGRTWFGSGGNIGRNGVGFLLHNRWAHNAFWA